MNDERTCEGCKWVVCKEERFYDGPEDDGLFECHRFPPTMFGLISIELAKDLGRTEFDGIWPDVKYNDYCGEFQPRDKTAE